MLRRQRPATRRSVFATSLGPRHAAMHGCKIGHAWIAQFPENLCCFSWPFARRWPFGRTARRLPGAKISKGRKSVGSRARRMLNFTWNAIERTSGDAHAGQGAELIQISGSLGTYAYFAHDVPAGRFVAELTPSVWVKANRPGIQILARDTAAIDRSTHRQADCHAGAGHQLFVGRIVAAIAHCGYSAVA